MNILNFILVVTLIGILLWAINTYLPLEARVAKFLNIAVVVLLVVWLLNGLGVVNLVTLPTLVPIQK